MKTLKLTLAALAFFFMMLEPNDLTIGWVASYLIAILTFGWALRSYEPQNEEK